MKAGGVSVVMVMMVVMVVTVRAVCKIENPRSCDSGKPQSVVNLVEYNGTCEGKSPKKPVIVIGETYNIKLSFRPVEDAKHALLKVWVLFGPLLIPQDVGNPDACVKKGLKCPLSADHSYTYTSLIHVSSHIHFYRPENLQIMWGLVDETAASLVGERNERMHIKHKIFCVNLPVILKPPSKPSVTNTTRRAPISAPVFKVV